MMMSENKKQKINKRSVQARSNKSTEHHSEQERLNSHHTRTRQHSTHNSTAWYRDTGGTMTITQQASQQQMKRRESINYPGEGNKSKEGKRDWYQGINSPHGRLRTSPASSHRGTNSGIAKKEAPTAKIRNQISITKSIKTEAKERE